jgi:hypothetical protein
MNNYKVKQARKLFRKQTEKLAKGKYGFEIFRLARKRDILGIILILENIALIVLFFIFILPLIK